ncbi:Hint domain-containing protein [Roseovarius ramblicola]|uniref:Hint domain-containing protein n=1 Tax=Roseovarius ramblicola TaxID=2022336 RepID=A0ABV5HWT7_9RHOB
MSLPCFGADLPPSIPVARSQSATRLYSCLWRDAGGRLMAQERRLPAMPLLDAAHAAFARGALVSTPGGPVAVEDLSPGDMIATAAGGAVPVVWIGLVTLWPGPSGEGVPLTRVMADAFGPGRPLADLVAGPGARLLSRPRNLRARIGAGGVLSPVHAMADGAHAIRMAARQPATFFHLALRRHALIVVNGLETESYHPGAGFERGLDEVTLRQVMAAFPHLGAPQDFGPLARMRLPLDAPETPDLV